MSSSLEQRLQQYTLKRPHEVLLVSVEIDGQPDEVAIFKGFSSSLVNPTAFDPEVPVLPENAKILLIDRVHSPYNPNDPQYIEKEISWEDFQQVLASVKV